jgi:ParB-like chromosome segregation protein Spo0J
VRLDENVTSYDVARDGRSGEGRLQEVRLDRIEPSPYQVRLVFAEAEIEKLAESIAATGLIHEPRGRPHPTRAGWVELMPGEMRVRALRRLIERDQAEGVLTRDGEGHWLVPIRVEPTDDDRADAMVFGENFDRADLSAWEWAVAFQRRRERLRDRGEAHGVRDVAASMKKRAFQTVGEYLHVADALTMELLSGAGVLEEGAPAHARLARLSLAALLRVARSAARGSSAGVQALLVELKKVGDAAAADVLERRERALGRSAQDGESGLQLNIRQPLAEVPPRQAVTYLARLAPAVAVLAGRAAGVDGADVPAIVTDLESAVLVLRSGGPADDA